MINWLKSLPLFLELNGFRVIHATWDDQMIERLRYYSNSQGQLRDETWQEALTKGTLLHSAIRVLLKGASISPPTLLQKEVRNVKLRKKYRICWWSKNVSSWQRILCSARDAKVFSHTPLPSHFPFKSEYNEKQSALFIGHYWFKGTPKPLKRNLACVDYSACRGGKLTAYVWNHADKPNENGLRADRFISVPSNDYRQACQQEDPNQ
jgi:hypothetical protein